MNILARRRRPARLVVFVVFCGFVLLLVSCAHQPQPPAADADLPGFWSGLLHGFLILFSFIGSLFTDLRIYACPNSGGWYDFGYLLGAAIFLGGGGASAEIASCD
jgi:hypothetical protein